MNSLCPGCDAARSTSRSAASQNRDPGFFESKVTGTPDLQRTVPQVLHAALRPGHKPMTTLAKKNFCIPYPRPPRRAYYRSRPVR